MTSTVDREPTLADVVNKLDTLTQDVERSNERFANYQQAVQWVVQLAFSLIASATVTVIITSVLRR
jgi:nitrate/nitrite-specific signal transduction histidine kinase